MEEERPKSGTLEGNNVEELGRRVQNTLNGQASLLREAYVELEHLKDSVSRLEHASPHTPSLLERHDRIVTNLPVPPRQFIGRKPLLDSLKAFLESAADSNTCIPHLAVLTAGGGFGKTAVTQECARLLRPQYQYRFWLNADSSFDFETSLRTMFSLLQLSEVTSQISLAFVESELIQWLDSHTSWLVVFDNADTPNTFLENSSFLSRLMALSNPPTSPHAQKFSSLRSVLLTSRYGEQSRWMSLHGVVELYSLELLGQEESESLLYSVVSLGQPHRSDDFKTFLETSPAEEQAALSWICGKQCLDGLPLAIKQVGGLISGKRTWEATSRFRRFVELVKSKPLSSPFLVGIPTSIDKARESIMSTSLLSLKSLAEDGTFPHGSCCVELFYLCSFLSPDGVMIPFLLNLINELPHDSPSELRQLIQDLDEEAATEELRNLVSTLSSLHLLELKVHECCWSSCGMCELKTDEVAMHRLVQLVSRNHFLFMESAFLPRQLPREDMLRALFRGTKKALKSNRDYFQARRQCLSLCTMEDASLEILLSHKSDSLLYPECSREIVSLIAAWEDTFITGNSEVTVVLDKLAGIICRCSTRPFVAGRLLQCIGSMKLKLHPRKTNNDAVFLLNEAKCHLEEALPLLLAEPMAETQVTLLSSAHRLLAKANSLLGLTQVAIEHLQAALDLTGAASSFPSLCFEILNEMGDLHSNLDDYENARECFLAALEIMENDHLVTPLGIAAQLNKISHFYSTKLKSYENANRYGLRAYDTLLSILGINSHHSAEQLVRLGSLARDHGFEQVAMEWYQQAFSIFVNLRAESEISTLKLLMMGPSLEEQSVYSESRISLNLSDSLYFPSVSSRSLTSISSGSLPSVSDLEQVKQVPNDRPEDVDIAALDKRAEELFISGEDFDLASSYWDQIVAVLTQALMSSCDFSLLVWRLDHLLLEGYSSNDYIPSLSSKQVTLEKVALFKLINLLCRFADRFFSKHRYDLSCKYWDQCIALLEKEMAKAPSKFFTMLERTTRYMFSDFKSQLAYKFWDQLIGSFAQERQAPGDPSNLFALIEQVASLLSSSKQHELACKYWDHYLAVLEREHQISGNASKLTKALDHIAENMFHYGKPDLARTYWDRCIDLLTQENQRSNDPSKLIATLTSIIERADAIKSDYITKLLSFTHLAHRSAPSKLLAKIDNIADRLMSKFKLGRSFFNYYGQCASLFRGPILEE